MDYTDFRSKIIDYVDNLSNNIFRHSVTKNDLVNKIFDLSSDIKDRESFQISFEQILEHFTTKNNEAIWRWDFSLPEWEATYIVDNDTFVFERILDSEDIKRIVKIREERLKENLAKKIQSLSPEECEIFVGRLFDEVPWIEEIEVTQFSHDGGIDFKGKIKKRSVSRSYNLIGQVKQYTSKLGGPDMRNFMGALSSYAPNNTVGYFVCTGGFNSESVALSEGGQHTIELFDMDKILDLMLEYSIGINSLELHLSDTDSNFWKYK